MLYNIYYILYYIFPFLEFDPCIDISMQLPILHAVLAWFVVFFLTDFSSQRCEEV